MAAFAAFVTVVTGLLATAQVADAASKLPAVITSLTPNYGSFAGGTYITIKGTGFVVDGTDTRTMVYVSNGVCEVIEYYSNMNQIVCVTPPSASTDTLSVKVALENPEFAAYAKCAANCRFQHRDSETPSLRGWTHGVASGADMQLWGYLRGRTADQYDIRVGGKACPLIKDKDDKIQDHWHSYTDLQCTVPPLTAGRHNIDINVKTHSYDVRMGNGDAVTHHNAWRVDEDGLFHVTVYPVVESISHASSGSNGGDTVVITGQSFDEDCANNKVYLEGEECVVTACSETTITCTTPVAPSSPPSGPIGTRGLTHSLWEGSWYPPTGEPTEVSTQASSLTGLGRHYKDRYAQQFDGFFVPPHTGNYTWYVRADDYGSVMISEDETEEGLKQVAVCPRYLTNYWTQAGQISDPVYMTAGRRYRFRAAHAEGGGGDFIDVALKVQHDGARSETQTAYQTAPTVQLLSVKPDIVRELQQIDIINAVSGKFLLSHAGKLSDPVTLGNKGAFATAVKAVTGVSNSVTLTKVEANHYRYTVKFNGPRGAGFETLQVHQTSIAPLQVNGTLEILSNRTRHASTPVSGSFRLAVNSEWTEHIPSNANGNTVRSALIKLTDVQDVAVTNWGNHYDGMNYRMEFTRPSGNFPALQWDTASLNGNNVRGETTVWHAGSTDQWYNAAPMEFFQTLRSAHSAVVVTNGVRGMCADHNVSANACEFTFDDSLNAEVTNVIASEPVLYEDEIILQGTGFVGKKSLSVTLGDQPCTVKTATDTSAVIKVPLIGEGTHDLKVFVAGKGLANGLPVEVASGFRFDSVGPLEGGLRGGGILTVRGVGYQATKDANSITIGGAECDIVEASFGLLRCLVPPAKDNMDSVLRNDSEIIKVNLTINSEVYETQYAYTWDLTPAITAVSPASVSPAFATKITMTGDFPPKAEQKRNCREGVKEVASVRFGDRVCERVKISTDGSTLTCRMPSGDADGFDAQDGQTPQVSLCSADGIFVAHPDPGVAVDFALRVTSVSQHAGSMAGGSVLVLEGRGFGSNKRVVSTTIQGNGTTVACNLQSLSDTKITCETDAVEQELFGTVVVTINTQGVPCADCTFNMTAEHTPTVDTISPLAGDYNDLVTITGSLFDADTTIRLGDSDCVVEGTISNTSLQCRVPESAGSVYLVTAFVPSLGRAANADEVAFAHTTTFTSVEPETGSSVGGTKVTLTGRGFSSNKGSNVVVVGNRRAAVVNRRYDRLVIITPTLGKSLGDSDETLKANIRVVTAASDALASGEPGTSAMCGNATSCSFLYAAAATPRVSGISPGNGARGSVITITGEFAGLGNRDLQVTIGGTDCDVDRSLISDEQIVCTLGDVPAGEHKVYVEVKGLGVAFPLLRFTASQTLDTVSPTEFGYGGGETLTVTGTGFSSDPDRTFMRVCGVSCRVTESSYTEAKCITPVVHTVESVERFGNSASGVLQGTVTAGAGLFNSRSAFDDNYESVMGSDSARRSSCYLDYDLGVDVLAQVETVRYHPRLKYLQRANNAAISVSRDGETWTEVLNTGVTEHEGWNARAVDDAPLARFIRYQGGRDSYCQLAELQFVGQVYNAASNNCNVSVGVRPPPAHLSEGHELASRRVFALDTKVDAFDAESACQAEGAHLVSLHSDTDFHEALSICPSECWIGMVRDSLDSTSRDDWYWSDGTPVDYQRWAQSSEGYNSRELAVMVRKDDPRGWRDYPHTTKYTPLCAYTEELSTIEKSPTGHIGLDTVGKVDFSWQIVQDSTVLSMTVKVQNEGRWFGVGFNSQFSMPGADVITWDPIAEKITDRKAFGKYEPVPDGQQDVNLVSFSISADGKTTTLQMTRKLATGDGNDQVITDGDTFVLYALGTEAAIGYHGSRGGRKLNLMKPEVQARAEANVVRDFMPAQHLVSQDTVSFSIPQTMEVVSLSPVHGPSIGDTDVTITGVNLPTTVGDAAVAINGHQCVVTSAAADGSELVCKTTSRGTTLNPLSLVVARKGGNGGHAVSKAGVRFRYLDPWSEITTWKDNNPPVEGDFVVIPDNQVVLLDESPEKLSFLLVHGELVFDNRPEADLTLQSEYIFIMGGKFEVGSEAKPYEGRAEIILHGDRYTSQGVPQIGRKVLAVSDRTFTHHDQGAGAFVDQSDVGVLELHGRKRLRTWTKVTASADAGTNTIVAAEDVDFGPGDKIILTSTKIFSETERLTVASLGADKRTITVEEALQFDHESKVFDYNGRAIDMRGEVALLSRNVIVRGDDTSPKQLFGSHIIVAHSGQARIEGTEVFNCGQAGQLGRYCVHFHMTGNRANSYVRDNSIHDSFQRAVTIHGTHRLKVQRNVAFFVKGHTYFVEDGIERDNLIEGNLGVWTYPSHVMLGSDTKPATFWTASPMNIWRNNVAAGCTHDGYWLELPGSPGGPSFTTTICPVHEHLLEFRDNTAHSNGVHGLRIYPQYTPLEEPCNSNSKPMPQDFYDFLSFHNGANGIFGKKNGDLHHHNPVLVENGAAELNWFKFPTVHFHLNRPNVIDGLFIGSTDPSASVSGVGLFMPQDEYFHVAGATFVNYQNSGAIAGCNGCNSDQFMKQGGFTFRLEGLKFDNSAKRTKWTAPYKQIFFDLDGSLTGIVNGTAMPFFAFNLYDGVCDQQDSTYDKGIVCDNSVRVRRVQIDGLSLKEMDWKVFGLEQRVASSVPGSAVKSSPGEHHDVVKFRPKEIYGWVMPVVTHNRYSANWITLMDWRTLRMRYTEPEYLMHYEAPGEHMALEWNYTDYRWSYEVLYAENKEREVLPVTITEDITSETDFGVGQIDHDLQVWGVALSSSGVDHSLYKPGARYANGPYEFRANAIQCAPDACNYLPGDEPLGDPTLYSKVEYWCRADGTAEFNDWTQHRKCEGRKQFPQEGDNVIIGNGMYCVMNVNPPRLNSLTILGKLLFEDTADRVIESNTILVWGYLTIGSVARPFKHKATVRLHGVRTSPTLIVHNDLFLGNKVMAVIGHLDMHGVAPDVAWTRLADTLEANSTTLELLEKVDWEAGDEIVVSSTEYDGAEAETFLISAVSEDGLTLTLDRPAANRHYSGVVDNGPNQDVALRATVAKLNRNVVFEGADDGFRHVPGPGGSEKMTVEGLNYGAHIVVAQVPFDDAPTKSGQSHISGTNLYRCGKHEMEHACILYKHHLRFHEDSVPFNTLENSVMSYSMNYGVSSEQSKGVVLKNNVLHRTFRSAIDLEAGTSGTVVEDNLIVDNKPTPDETDEWTRPTAGIFVDAKIKSLKRNVVAGAFDSGFVFRADKCNLDSPVILDNEAFASRIGFFIMSVGNDDCLELRRSKAWKIAHTAFLTVDQTANVVLDEVISADSHIGVSLNFIRRKEFSRAVVKSSHILGATDASTCDGSLECRASNKRDPAATGCNSVFGSRFRRVGIITTQYLNAAKTCHRHGGLPVCRPLTTPERMCSMPWEKRHGLPSTKVAQFDVIDTAFSHFKADDCGKRSIAFTTNPSQPDYTPHIVFDGITWHNSEPQARIKLDGSTGQPGECKTACDGVLFAVADDRDGSMSGMGQAGTLISGQNPALADGPDRCTYSKDMGLFKCATVSRAAVLHTLDKDAGRHFGPVKIVKKPLADEAERIVFAQGPNKDPCPIRMHFGQFPLEFEPGREYMLNVSGTLPNNVRLIFNSEDPDESVLIRLMIYKDSMAMKLYNADKLVPASNAIPTLSSPRGANLYDARFTMYITLRGSPKESERRYTLRTTNVVQVTMTLAVSQEVFFGPSIVEMLALLLDISQDRIKIVDAKTKKKTKQIAEVLQEDVSQFSDRRRSVDEVEIADDEVLDITFEIVDEVEEPPTNDEDQEAQLGRLEDIMDRLEEATANRELEDALEETFPGSELVFVVITPPAGAGLVAPKALVAVKTTPASAAVDTTLIAVGSAVGAVVVLAFVVALILLKKKHDGSQPVKVRNDGSMALPSWSPADKGVTKHASLVKPARAEKSRRSLRNKTGSFKFDTQVLETLGAELEGGRKVSHGEQVYDIGDLVVQDFEPTYDLGEDDKKNGYLETENGADEPSYVLGNNVGDPTYALGDNSEQATYDMAVASGDQTYSMAKAGGEEATYDMGDNVGAEATYDMGDNVGAEATYDMGDNVGAEATYDFGNVKTRSEKPSGDERFQALLSMQHREKEANTWNYVQNLEFHHPKATEKKATSLLAHGQNGAFLVYGSERLFLAVNSYGGETHHIPILRQDDGLVLNVGEEDVVHSDLKALVEYYSVPRNTTDFICSKDEEVHFLTLKRRKKGRLSFGLTGSAKAKTGKTQSSSALL